jgi:hypothetical protein
MKRLLFSLVGLLVLDASLPTARAADGYDSTHRFIYYAVLEGCYEDGLSNQDIDQILLKGGQHTHLHFVYSCPVCMPTIHALEAYRSRPERFYGMKSDTSTFGKGLEPALGAKLHSTNATARLETINALVQRWIQRRMTQLRLNEAERAALQGELETKRKKGMEALQRFTKSGNTETFAPGLAEHGQCAACNGAVGLEYLPPQKP